MATRVKLKVPKITLFNPAQLLATTTKTMQGFHTHVLQIMTTKAREKTPVGATRRLVNSITGETKQASATRTQLILSWTAPHARPVNEGTKPHWAPIGPLKQWTRAKIGSEGFAYMLQRSIAKRGTRPKNYVDKTGRAIRGPVIQAFQQVGSFLRKAILR